MTRVELSCQLSPDDIEAIVCGVVKRIAPLLESRPLLVDGDKLSAILGISRPTIDRLVRHGRVPSVKAGSRRLFDPVKVIATLESESGVSDG